MILLSAHLDRVHANFALSYKNGKLTGLLDNIVGVMAVHTALLDEPNLQILERTGKLAVYHNLSEEWGMLDGNLPSPLTKNDVVIVVDVCSHPRYHGYDFGIENIANFEKGENKKLKDFFQWEGYTPLVREWTGDSSDEDEAFYFKKLGIPVLSFIIPVDAPNFGWHRIQDDNSISYEKLKVCIEGIKRLICYYND